jgi:hypothetical protein
MIQRKGSCLDLLGMYNACKGDPQENLAKTTIFGTVSKGSEKRIF